MDGWVLRVALVAQEREEVGGDRPEGRWVCVCVCGGGGGNHWQETDQFLGLIDLTLEAALEREPRELVRRELHVTSHSC
jgi:hypothetical protein